MHHGTEDLISGLRCQGRLWDTSSTLVYALSVGQNCNKCPVEENAGLIGFEFDTVAKYYTVS